MDESTEIKLTKIETLLETVTQRSDERDALLQAAIEKVCAHIDTINNRLTHVEQTIQTHELLLNRLEQLVSTHEEPENYFNKLITSAVIFVVAALVGAAISKLF